MVAPNSKHRPVGKTLQARGSAKNAQVRFSDAMLKELDTLAGQYRLTRSTVVRACVKVAFKRMDVLHAQLEQEIF